MQTIRELRQARGWTQEELAARVGVTKVTVYNWERGEHMIPAPSLRTLAQAFGVPMDTIDFERPYNARTQEGTRRQRHTSPGPVPRTGKEGSE